MEIDSSENLPKLFRTDFLVCVSVPILEETFDVQPGGDTESVEPLLQVLDDGQLLFVHFCFPVVVLQVHFLRLLRRVTAFQPFHLEHFVHRVAEATPVHFVTLQLVFLSLNHFYSD